MPLPLFTPEMTLQRLIMKQSREVSRGQRGLLFLPCP